MDNQIEELTNDIAKVLYGVEDSDILNVAYFLDEQGYRKIPEGAVVLTRSHEDKIFNDYVEYIKKVRKETVEKIAAELNDIKVKLSLVGNPYACQYTQGDIEAVANGMRNAFLIRLNEIAKEITEGDNG